MLAAVWKKKGSEDGGDAGKAVLCEHGKSGGCLLLSDYPKLLGGVSSARKEGQRTVGKVSEQCGTAHQLSCYPSCTLEEPADCALRAV